MLNKAFYIHQNQLLIGLSTVSEQTAEQYSQEFQLPATHLLQN